MAGQNTTAKTTAAKAAEPDTSAAEEFAATLAEKAAENRGEVALTPGDLPLDVLIKTYVGLPNSGVELRLAATGEVTWVAASGQVADLLVVVEADAE